MLQPFSRDCFVLRILAGLSPEVCAELLDVSISELEGAVCAALNQLPLRSSSTDDSHLGSGAGDQRYAPLVCSY
jgi:hypothetical protein